MAFTINGIFGSNMVLQRNTKICISGSGANDIVSINFDNNIFSSFPDSNENWKIEFNSPDAGGPYNLEIRYKDILIQYSNIYVGEVWIVSGQSNAQLPMQRLKYSYREEFSQRNNKIKILTIPISFSFNSEIKQIENIEWKEINEENLLSLSGTSYFFAKKLFEDLNVPIGIINVSQGGSPITSWIDENSLIKLKKESYLSRLNLWKDKKNIIEKKDEVLKLQQKWDKDLLENDLGYKNLFDKQFNKSLFEWQKFTIPGNFEELGKNGGIVWFHKRFVLTNDDLQNLTDKLNLWFGTIQDADKIWINNNFCGVTYYTYPPRRYEIFKEFLHLGDNDIVICIQKNGSGPIRFYEEKKYLLFNENLYVHPVAYRNVEKPKSSKTNCGKDFIFDLSGEWEYCITSRTITRPDEMFFEWEPTALFNGMLSPCFDYSVAGVVWYQGESNASEFKEYKDLLIEMIDLWRRKFIYSSKKMPFILMQLPNWADGYRDEKMQNFGDWAEMRDSIISVSEEVENTTSVCLIDAGEWNDLHPEKKFTCGTRAAKEALRLVYNKNYNFAPKISSMRKIQNKIHLVFDCGNSSLKAFKVIDEYADFEIEDQTVYGFELMDKEGNKFAIKGNLINKNVVELQISEGKNFIEIRYLWANNPWIVNLYSSELIPACPFRMKL